MYAVVEFLVGEERECALVPVLWLIENNTKCYWPRTKTEDHFTKLVKSKAAYDETWPKFAVHKVLHTCEDLNDAEVIMTRFLELGTSDESGIIHNMTKKSTVVVQKDVANDAEENVTANRKHIDVEPEQQRKKRKHKSNKSYQSDNSDNSDKKKSKKRHVSKKKKKTKLRRENSSISNYTSSSDDENVPPPKNNQSNLNRNNDITSANRFSADDTPKRKSANRITHHSIDDEIYNSSNHLSGDETPKRKSTNRTRHHPNIDDTYDSTNQFSGNGTPNRNVTNRIVRSTTQYDLSKSGLLSDPSTLTPSRKQNTFEEKTLRYLEHIKSYVDQNHLLLRKIFSKQKEVTVEITKKPVEFPKLPLNSMQEFSKLEELLKSEQHRTYLTQKLASIGGTNSRQCVLAMMRVLLTNELAMQFNWAGRDKVPFQKTSTMETVYEAVKQTFLGKQEIGNVTETSVSCAVKDWLKLARSRHTYVPKRR